jgi:GNAT superfamily N-acetyltransferase
MALAITTDTAKILRLIEPALLADPVRNTILGSIQASLRASGGPGWCASDGAALAVRSSPDHPIALTEGWSALRAVAAAIDALPAVVGIGGPVAAIDGLLEHSARRPTHRRGERLFRLDRLVEPTGVVGEARLGTDNDVDGLIDWYRAFAVEALSGPPPASAELRARVESAIAAGAAHMWVDPTAAAVSMAMGRPAVSGVARIGPVYTPPRFRGYGYASAITARAARAILDATAVPVLHTDLANPTSNKIYQELGFRAVADRASITFS